MGYLIPILLALVAQGMAEEGLATQVERPWIVAALVLVPHLLGAAARRASLAGRFLTAGRLLASLAALPVVLHALALLACGWNASLERLTGMQPRLLGWPNWSALASLLPLAVYSTLAIDARARAMDSRPPEVRRQRRFHLRMFSATLLPIAIYLALMGAAGASEALRARVDNVQLDAALFACVLLALFLASMPFFLRLTWDTHPLPAGALREMFESSARRAGFGCRQILVWNTGNLMVNAAIVGLTARLRLVFLSDALLAFLTPRELLAVFAHEMGHARRHHVLVFVCWTAAFFLGADLLLVRWLPGGDVWALGALAVVVPLWYTGFGWLSRRFELDADLYAVELTGDVEGMASALASVGGPHGGARRTWRHFSIDRRVEFLRAYAVDATTGLALRRRLRVLTWVGVLLALASVGLQAQGILRSYPVESVRSQLAGGRPERARQSLERVVEPPAALVRQVALATELGLGGPHDGELLVRAVRASLARDEFERCLDLLGLGLLRDPERFEGPLRGIRSGPEGGVPDDWELAQRELVQDRDTWVRALGRVLAELEAAGAGPRGSDGPR